MIINGRQMLGGKYRLIQRLGRGGQAEIWRAEQTGIAGFSRDVVLKIVHSFHRGEEPIDGLLHEARLAARIQHPNVVSIFEAGEEEGLVYIAMEYIEGRDLKALLRQSIQAEEQPLPWPLVVYIGIQLCQGLYYAHTLRDKSGKHYRIIHRDLKPDNVLISREGFVKIIDFGIAKADEALRPATEPGKVKGTPHYMSPEQLSDEPLDGRSDLFSLGIILYELCTGRRPFAGEGAFSAMMSIVSHPPFGLDEDPLPEALKDLLMQLLKKAPDRRPASAKELQRSLQGISYGEGEVVDQSDVRDYYHRLYGEQHEVALGSGTFHAAREASGLKGFLTTESIAAVDSTASLPQALSRPSYPAPHTPPETGSQERWVWLLSCVALALFGVLIAMLLYTPSCHTPAGPRSSPTAQKRSLPLPTIPKIRRHIAEQNAPR